MCGPLQQLRISKHNSESQTSLHCLAHATNVTWQLPFTMDDLKNITTSGANCKMKQTCNKLTSMPQWNEHLKYASNSSFKMNY